VYGERLHEAITANSAVPLISGFRVLENFLNTSQGRMLTGHGRDPEQRYG
jgi:hypothetical protein